MKKKNKALERIIAVALCDENTLYGTPEEDECNKNMYDDEATTFVNYEAETFFDDYYDDDDDDYEKLQKLYDEIDEEIKEEERFNAYIKKSKEDNEHENEEDEPPEADGEDDYCLECADCELLNDCELINSSEDAEVPYYQIEYQSKCQLKKYMPREIICCGNQKVSDGIGYDFAEWFPYTLTENTDLEDESKPAIFISSMTGGGKNYFIENILLIQHLVRRWNYGKINGKVDDKRMLIITNRTALRTQIKNRLKEDFDDISHADIILYQSVLSFIETAEFNAIKEKYAYVVFDEIHFISSDSMFNPYTYQIYSKLVDIFRNTIRIYMTATPYDCMGYIFEKENIPHRKDVKKIDEEYAKVIDNRKYRNCPSDYYSSDTYILINSDNKDEHRRFYTYSYIGGEKQFTCADEDIKKYFNDKKEELLKKSMYFYHFTRSYPQIDKINYFSTSKEMISIISDVVNVKKEKCLLFNNDMTGNQKLKDKLEEDERLKGKILVISAESKRDTKFQDMLEKEKFPKNIYVIISTTVIDNGVNFKDPELKYIILGELDRTECLQQFGRIRVERDENDDIKSKICLYLRKFNAEYVEKRIKNIQQKEDNYYMYDIAYKREQQDSLYERRNFVNRHYHRDRELKEIRGTHQMFGMDMDNPEFTITNEIAHSLNNPEDSMLERSLLRYKSILKEMKATGNGISYLKHQLSWFGHEYDVKNDLTLNGAKTTDHLKFEEFLRKWVGKKISKKEIKNSFGLEFFNAYYPIYGYCQLKDGFKSKDNISENTGVQCVGYRTPRMREILEVKKFEFELIEYEDKSIMFKELRRTPETPKTE